jgi:hypothetical protein
MVDDVIFQKTMSNEKFIKEIENLVKTYNLDYMDAVVHLCEKNNIEIEAAASIIKNNIKIKAKLQATAEDLNYLPKSARLPI